MAWAVVVLVLDAEAGGKDSAVVLSPVYFLHSVRRRWWYTREQGKRENKKRPTRWPPDEFI